MALTLSMNRWNRRDLYWTFLIAIPGILILLSLGSWQVHRMLWKTETNQYRQERSQSEPIALPEKNVNVQEMLFRPVQVTGYFLHHQEMFLAARSYRSNPGYHVITPFQRSEGGKILINRGWVPVDNRDPETRINGQTEGLVSITGLLVSGNTPGWMTPENRPEENFWFWLDLPSLSTQANIPIQQYLIDADSSPNSGGFPIGGQTRTELRNEHLQYVVIWYALAICLAGITFLMIRSRKQRRAVEKNDR